MKILQTDKKEKCLVEALVEVGPKEYDEAAGKAFIKNKNRVAVPGFRKGKAPRRIVEKMYGADIFLNDSLEIMYPEILKLFADDPELKIVDRPTITDVDLKEGEEGINITVTFTIYPEVNIGEYKGVSAPKESYEVPESEIDSEIAALRLRNARIESVDRVAADGDITIIDFEGFLDGEPFDGGKGENYELELGSNSFIPGFEEKICGMAIGEERDLDLTFPEQYAEHLAGKAVVFKVKLHEVKEKQLPDIDDEFAKDVSEFDTIAEYKADIRKRFEEEKKAKVDEAFETAIMDKIIEGMDNEVPDAMVEERMDFVMQNFARQMSAYNMDPAQYLKMVGMTPEEFRENSREGAEKQAKIALALEKIAELEDIKVSEEELEEEFKKAAEELDKDIDEIKKTADKDGLMHELKIRAALKTVVDSAIALDADTEADSGESSKPAKKKTAAKKKKAETASKKSEKTDKDKGKDKDNKTQNKGDEK